MADGHLLTDHYHVSLITATLRIVSNSHYIALLMKYDDAGGGYWHAFRGLDESHRGGNGGETSQIMQLLVSQLHIM